MTNILAKFKRASDLFEKRQNGSKTSRLPCSNPKSRKCQPTQPLLMLKITILGLVLVAIALSGAVSVASAETVPSPLQQVRDGIPASEVECADGRVLVLSPSGMPACVFVASATMLETRGFAWLDCMSCEPGASNETVIDLSPDQTIYADTFSESTVYGSQIPVVSISRLPNLGETAILEVTTTNEIVNVSESAALHQFYTTGWFISSGFEIVDPVDVQYETRHGIGLHAWARNLTMYEYQVPTPLDVGESKTHRVEIRAVKEGHHSIMGIGYGATASIHLYISQNNTMLESEHQPMYPELHTLQTSTQSADHRHTSSHMTADEELQMAKHGYVTRGNTTVTYPPWEEEKEWFVKWIRSNDLTMKEFVDSMQVFFNSTQLREILVDSGFHEDEIDRIITQSTRTRDAPQNFFIYGYITNDQIPVGKGDTTMVNGVMVCAHDYNVVLMVLNPASLVCDNTTENGMYLLKFFDVVDPDDRNSNVDVHIKILSDSLYSQVLNLAGHHYETIPYMSTDTPTNNRAYA